VSHASRRPLLTRCGRAPDPRQVAMRLQPYHVLPGDSVLREGEQGHDFFIIADGKARTRQWAPYRASRYPPAILAGLRPG
jgi:hypothetical protein